MPWGENGVGATASARVPAGCHDQTSKVWNCPPAAICGLASSLFVIDRAVEQAGSVDPVGAQGGDGLIVSGWAVAIAATGWTMPGRRKQRKARRGTWASDIMMPWDWRRR